MSNQNKLLEGHARQHRLVVEGSDRQMGSAGLLVSAVWPIRQLPTMQIAAFRFESPFEKISMNVTAGMERSFYKWLRNDDYGRRNGEFGLRFLSPGRLEMTFSELHMGTRMRFVENPFSRPVRAIVLWLTKDEMDVFYAMVADAVGIVEDAARHRS